MLHWSKALQLAFAVSLVALLATTASAWATTEFTYSPGGGINAVSEGKLSFQAGTNTVSCRVTLGGTLLTTAIPVTSGSTFGLLTSARFAECTGGSVERALISEREGWALKVSSLLGSLPESITGLLFTISNMRILFSILGIINCLYEGTAGALLALTRAEDLSFRAGAARFLERETFRLVRGASCPESGTIRGSLTFSAAQTLKLRMPLAVAVGDSFTSGEAGRWAGNVTSAANWANIDALGANAYLDAFDRSGETIPFCHRSIEGEIQIGEGFAGKDLACSGAKSRSRMAGTQFKPGLDFEVVEGQPGQAKQLQEYAEAHREIKLVAVSIGGNDFEFGWIAQQCVLAYLFPLVHRQCSEQQAVLAKLSAAEIRANLRSITTSLRNIHEAMVRAGYRDEQYVIVVQNYMSLIPHGRGFRYTMIEGVEDPAREETEAEWEETGPAEYEYEEGEENFRAHARQSRGGCGFRDADASWANVTVLPTINNTVATAIAESRVRVTQLRLASVFEGRRLCEAGIGTIEEMRLADWRAARAVDRTEWVNRILFVAGTSPIMVQESLHPNQWGERALRNCLRRAYNGRAPREGECTIREAGLNERSEPQMDLR